MPLNEDAKSNIVRSATTFERDNRENGFRAEMQGWSKERLDTELSRLIDRPTTTTREWRNAVLYTAKSRLWNAS